ncbi:MAG: S8/S53 family peptidase, partial [Chloroflexota bacterium]
MSAEMMRPVYRYFSEGDLIFHIAYEGQDLSREEKQALTQALINTLPHEFRRIREKICNGESLLVGELPNLANCTPDEQEIVTIAEDARRSAEQFFPDDQGLNELFKAYEGCDTFQTVGVLNANNDNKEAQSLLIDTFPFLNITRDMYIEADEVDLALLYIVGEMRLHFERHPLEIAKVARFNISPNWRIAGSMSGGSLFSAPGVIPVPDRGENQNIGVGTYGFEALDSQSELGVILKQNQKETFEIAKDQSDSGVDVFILDTLPSAGHLQQIANRYDTNRLIQHFFEDLETSGTARYATRGLKRLQYYTDYSDKDFFDPMLMVDGHDYDQSPHGPFVAGVVRSIAANANILMVQTINDKGVGTFKSMVWAMNQVSLYKAQPDNRDRTVLVNLSFGLAIQPEDVGADLDYPPAKFLRFLIDLEGDIDFLAEFNMALETLIANDIHVIAAAGNDGTCGKCYPPRLPAGSQSAVGVGALSSAEPARPACYTNEPGVTSEDPKGVYAVGGKNNGRYTSEKEGILSIYTNEKFPQNRENKTGWGRWAGTSFATPVVTGTV